MLHQRRVARARKDWAEADRLRAQIEELGWQVLDTPDGPQLEAIPQSGNERAARESSTRE
ncbi:MAG: hypothetical protein IPM07_29400 [Anaerolineales bacterium]|nr:hypothetical protein [Anaerolineales bacterium]